MVDLEMRLERAERLESTLKGLQKSVEDTDLSGVPPIWSGAVTDLEAFAKALQEYVDDPELDRAKRAVHQLVGLAGPDGASPNLSDEFLLASSDLLEKIKPVVEHIGNAKLCERAANHILTVIGVRSTTEAIEAALQSIEEYCEKAVELEDTIGHEPEPSPLLDAVGKDILSDLANPKSFEVSEILIANTTWTQAGNADTLGNALAIKNDLLRDYFQETGSVAALNTILDRIRVLVNETDFVRKMPEGVGSPPSDLAGARTAALGSGTLEQVKCSLENVSSAARAWLKELAAMAQLAVNQTESIMGYVELPSDVRNQMVKLKSSAADAVSTLNAESVFEFYRGAEELGQRVRQEVETNHNLTERQQKILSDPEQLAHLRMENPDGFWADIRGIVDLGLAEIRLEGKSANDD